jgi:hypothetical protein
LVSFRSQQISRAYNPRTLHRTPRIELSDEMLSRELREAVADDDQFRPEACSETQAGGAVRSEAHFEPAAFEQLGEHQPQPGVVFDDQRHMRGRL